MWLSHAHYGPFLLSRYTLGGLYLARYDDSPAGKFDEVGKLQPAHFFFSLPKRASRGLPLRGLIIPPTLPPPLRLSAGRSGRLGLESTDFVRMVPVAFLAIPCHFAHLPFGFLRR